MLNKVDSREASYNLQVYYTNQFLESIPSVDEAQPVYKDNVKGFLKNFHNVNFFI